MKIERPSQRQHKRSLEDALRGLVCLILSAALCGCTVLMQEPKRPTVAQRAAGLDYSLALEYLERARTNMNDGLAQVDDLDKVSRGAVGTGVGGAAVATLFKGSSDLILGLLTLGGAGYTVNQTSAFPLQASVYNAGLASLMCIERTSSLVHRDTGSIRAQLQGKQAPLTAAIAALTADVSAARTLQTMSFVLTPLVPQAEQAIKSALGLQRSVADFINATDVGSEMYYAVGRTVVAVNTQLRERAPKLDEIAKAGSVLTGFVGARSNLGADMDATKAAAKAPPAVSQGKAYIEPVVENIRRHLADVRQVVGEMEALLPPPGYAKAEAQLATCQALLPGQGVFKVTPAGPVNLKAGGEPYTLTVEVDLLPLSYGFHGLTPSAQQLVVSHPGERIFSLAAPAGAKADKYQFFIAQKDGRALPDIEVTVVASAPVTSTRTTPATTTTTTRTTTLTLDAKRSLLHLGADVKETDPVWKDRVKKLENCVGLPVSDGTLSNKLVAELRKREPVDSAGDCPAFKPTTTGSAVPAPTGTASAQKPVPIPPPPVLPPASAANR